jgi:S1-C subfamily serine protease
MCGQSAAAQNGGMSTSSLLEVSNQLSDIVDATAPSVVQVQGGRRPASGISYGTDTILTTTRALGRDENPTVLTAAGETFKAELVGWDPATGLAILRNAGVGLTPAAVAEAPARVGSVVLALARSWSNAITASAGIVAVIGGPLRTGRGQSIEQIIRTTAPMHDGFSGGPLVNAEGRVAGIATGGAIRGLSVVIPASIAWQTAASVLQHGRPRFGYLGVAGQPVRLGGRQREISGRDRGMLLLGVSAGGPAEAAGALVGDCVIDFDGYPVASPDDLLGLLVAGRVGQRASLRVLRGEAVVELAVTVGERPTSG